MTEERLQEIIESMSKVRVGVIGDFFLDRYHEIDPALEEVSVETGRAAHQVVRKWSSPGAAGTVVNNLLSLGGSVSVCGVIGDDGDAYELKHGLRHADTTGLLTSADLFTPVYSKTMVKGLSGLDAELDRFDTKNRQPVPDNIQSALCTEIDRLWPNVDAIIIADQVEAENCGVVSDRVRQHLIRKASADRSRIIWADSRRRIGLFENVSIKPNEAECVRAIHEIEKATTPDEQFDDDEVLRCGRALRERLGKDLCVTRARRGAMLFLAESEVVIRGIEVPEPTDPTGAGDSVMAGIALSQAAGASLKESAIIGMLVASITVQALGTTGTARPEELVERLACWHQQ